MSSYVKGREILIWGMGKMQQDFEYIFSDEKIAGYISESSHVGEYEGKPVYALVDVKKGQYLVVVCLNEKKAIHDKMLEMGWEQGVDFMDMDDFFPFLDEEERKLAVWGLGNTCKELLSQCDISRVSFFITSRQEEVGKHCDKEAIHYSMLLEQRKNKELIIIACGDTIGIEKILNEMGLIPQVDYMTMSYFCRWYNPNKEFITKPSEMMKKTVYAPMTDAPFCHEPFENATIAKRELLCCKCSVRLKNAIGVLNTDSLNEQWNSYRAKIFRLSVLNRTYCFCKKEQCVLLVHSKECETSKRFTYEARKYPAFINVSYDYSCNLYCHTCRKKVEMAAKEEREQMFQIVDDMAQNGWLEHGKSIGIAGDGEVFLSQAYQRIFDYDFHMEKLELLTNGLLFSEEKWKKIEGKADQICVSISVDAACQETYEKLRRGGNWVKLMENFKVISRLRKGNRIQFVQLNFVVQKDNYLQMEPFIDLAQSFGFDRVCFQRMFDTGVMDNYCNEGLLKQSGETKKKLVDIIKKIRQNPMVIDSFSKNL